jgi:hypothetical protein
LVTQNSDTILYCVEYPRLVLLLQIGSHVHLDSRPPGKNLTPMFQAQFRNLEVAAGVAALAIGLGLLFADKFKLKK